MTRFAYAFAGVATFAALTGGVAGLVVGQSGPAAPAVPNVGVAQTGWTPAVITPVDVAPAPVAQPVVTRTVTVVRHQTASPTPKATKPVSTANEPSGQTVNQIDQPDQPAPFGPVQAVEVDPTPSPTPPQSTGEPSSMHGTPDPTLGGVTPRDPAMTPPPLDR